MATKNMAENKKEIERKKSFNYGKLALILCLLIIGVWFFSHFRISIVAINKIDSIVNKTFYYCPDNASAAAFSAPA